MPSPVLQQSESFELRKTRVNDCFIAGHCRDNIVDRLSLRAQPQSCCNVT